MSDHPLPPDPEAHHDRSRSIWIDGLRAYCALTVVLYHGIAALPGMPLWISKRCSVLANLSVEMFFVISGYLITSSLLRRRLPGSGWSGYRAFMASRAARILPTAFAGLGAFYLVSWYVDQPFGHGDILLYMTFQTHWFQAVFGEQAVHGPGQYWSLAIEEHFYVVWSAVACALAMTASRPWLLLGVVVGTGLVVRSLMIAWGFDPVFFFLGRCDGLAAGVAIALIGLNRFRLVWRWWQVASAAIILAAATWGWFRFSGLGLGFVQVAKYPIVAAACAAVFIVCPRIHGISRFLSWSPIALIGRGSYSIYVIHGICIPLAAASTSRLAGDHAAISTWLWFSILYLTVTAAASFALHLGIERPTDRWSKALWRASGR